MRRFLPILIWLGAAFLVFGIYSLSREADFLSRAVHTQAVVTDSRVNPESGRDKNCPPLLFTRSDGQTVMYYGATCAANSAYEVGQSVAVLYDPLDSGWVQLDTFGAKYGAILTIFGIGALLLILGLSGLSRKKVEA